MKKFVYIMVSFLLSLLVASTEQCHARANSPSLKYLWNSFVKIKTSEGKVIYIDPYIATDPDSADIVLITHEHTDHNELFRITQKSTCQVIRAANALIDSVYQVFTIGNIKITAVPAYGGIYHLPYTGVGFVIEFDSIKIYHAGGTNAIPEMANLASQNITYALIGLGPGPEEMTGAAAMVHAQHDIPMHSIVSAANTEDYSVVRRFTSPHRLILLPNETIELTTDTSILPIHRTLRVPQDYPTIQAAIDSAQNSDTVLVSEGTYYENIRFKRKGIVVTSKYYMTHDWQTVQNTIINGSLAADKNHASAVQFMNGEDSTAVLDGFTLVSGTGTKYYAVINWQEGGGIIMNISSAIVRNNIIRNNVTQPLSGTTNGGGGGISSFYGNPTIQNNVIASNTAGYAGGIVLNWSKGKIWNNIIYHNNAGLAEGGGGIVLWQSPQNGGIVENNTIVGNISTSVGGGISISVTDATTIPIVRNNIVWGNRQATGGQVDNPQYVTGFNDIEDYRAGTNISIYPQLQDSTFLLSPSSPCSDAGDLAVTFNDNENPGNPGMALPPSTGTLRNDMGVFGGALAKFLGAIDIGDLRISKDTLWVQCIPGNQIPFTSIELLNLSSKSITIDSISHTNRQLFSLNKNFTEERLDLFAFDSLQVTFGPTFELGVFSDTIKIYHQINGKTNPLSIVVNISSNSTPYVYKTIPTQTSYVGQLFTFQIPDSIFLDNDTRDSLIYQVSGIPAWLSFDPQTRTFQGTPTKTTGPLPVMIKIIATDIVQAIAYTYLRITVLPPAGIENVQTRLLTYQLCQNYPNPFNPSTTIHFQIPISSEVSLKVFDVLGREVVSLLNERKNPGNYSVQWDAAGIPSGVYFYRLMTKEYSEVKKMLLTK